MAALQELLEEEVVHAVRSDGTRILAMKVNFSDTQQPRWEVRQIDKDGYFTKDDKITIADKPAVYRKTLTSEQLEELAKIGDYVEWESGFPQKTKTETSEDWAEGQETVQLEETLLPQIDQEKISQQSSDALEEVRRESPSQIQKIMAGQIKVGTRYYEEAVRQSAKSFQLARITTICSAALFETSIIVTIFTPTSWEVPVFGTILSAILQGIGQFSYMYNKASIQLANFHKFLDHISRALFAYTMGRESNDPDAVKRAIDQMLSSSELLKK